MTLNHHTQIDIEAELQQVAKCVRIDPPTIVQQLALNDTRAALLGTTFAKSIEFDNYQIIRLLGSGGMAKVYLATDTLLGRKVAIKFIQPSREAEEKAGQRFLFEAQVLARFNHPNIVTVYAVGEFENRPYLAMEYVDGQTLRERLVHERLSEKQAARIGLNIGQALTSAHQKNFLHRDLKPENVMIGIDGIVRVLDFGLAALTRHEADGESTNSESLRSVSFDYMLESQHRGLRGTPIYMAPEQWRDELVSAETDIWALGLILYEMLAGKHPYAGVGIEQVVIAQVCSDSTPVPALEKHGQISQELLSLVARCVSKERSSRPTAEEVCRELMQFLHGNQIPVAQDENPFRGLLPFEERHAQFFFGRETEITALVEQLREQPIMPVIGPSGAGKSSFIKAGVIPRLRERGPLLFFQLRPGRDPFSTLANRLCAQDNGPEVHSVTSREEISILATKLRESPTALGMHLVRLAQHSRSMVVLFVDQLEELCLLEDQKIADQFMLALATAADDPAILVRVIVTVKEAFFTQLLAKSRQVRKAFTSQIKVLGQPSAAALERMLIQPVEAAGYVYEDDTLVAEMVREVAEESACLPLLQFAAQQIWSGRDEARKMILRQTVDEMAGIVGALAQHADGVLKQLSHQEGKAVRTILLRLVTEDNARRSVREEELLVGLDSSASGLLDKLVESRLVTARQRHEGGGGEFELAHESLITRWTRLARWVEESRDDLRLQNQLRLAADLWVRKGRRQEDLLHGKSLSEANAITSNMDGLGPRTQQLITESNRRHRFTQFRLLSIAVMGILLLSGAYFVGRHFNLRGLCNGAEQHLQGSWDLQTKEKVKQSFLASGRPHAAETFRRVATHLDEWSSGWLAQQMQACKATHVEQTQPEEWLGLRTACLKRKLADLTSLVRFFGGQPDGQVVDKATEAVLSLGQIAICEDVQALKQEVPPPEDPAVRESVEALRRRLLDVRTLNRLGKYKQAQILLKEMGDQIDQVDYPPLGTEYLFEKGSTLSRIGNYQEAEQALQKTLKSALEWKQWVIAQRAADGLAFMMGFVKKQFDRGTAYGQTSLGLARGLGAKRLAAAMKTQAAVFFSQGKYGESRAMLQEMLTLLEKSFGAEHPQVAAVLNNLANIHVANGKYHQAESLYRKALTILEKTLGPSHPNVARALGNLASIQKDLGKFEGVEAMERRALAIKESTLGKDHPSVAKSLYNLGLTLTHQQKHSLAQQMFQRSISTFEKGVGREHPYLAYPLSGQGDVLYTTARYVQAKRSYERVLSLCSEQHCRPAPLAIARFGLARILGQEDKNRTRAVELAKLAWHAYGQDPAFKKEYDNIGRWLKNQGVTLEHPGKKAKER